MKSGSGRRNLPVALREEEPGVAIPTELETAFRAHHGMVFRTAYRITGNAADAEDVSQIVFLRLLRRDASAETLDNQESYLRRAAINASLDVIRSRQADRSVELTDEIPQDVTGNDMSELRQALGRAMAQLDPRRAEIFALRFLEGFTNPEIAKMLGMSQVLVAVLVHRTRQQLRKALSDYLGDRP
jgi:RNA polymerase sigma-70 factor, ECF subfamily